MMTHQGSRALNHINSTHAPYSANATNQVGPSTWKNFCLRNCIAWLQAAFYRLIMGFAKVRDSLGPNGIREGPRGSHAGSNTNAGCTTAARACARQYPVAV